MDSMRKRKGLLIYFFAGLLCDGIGTSFMEQLNTSREINLHGITGAVALILMLIHAIWAAIVLWRKSEKQIQQFHKFSLVVWGLWLVPYLGNDRNGIARNILPYASESQASLSGKNRYAYDWHEHRLCHVCRTRLPDSQHVGITCVFSGTSVIFLSSDPQLDSGGSGRRSIR
jgi:uncharacterized repeat protein (TIGR03987 family)